MMIETLQFYIMAHLMPILHLLIMGIPKMILHCLMVVRNIGLHLIDGLKLQILVLLANIILKLVVVVPPLKLLTLVKPEL